MTAASSNQNVLHPPERQEPTSVESVLLFLDGTPGSKKAIPVARHLARLYGATLHIAVAGKNALSPQEAARSLNLSAQEAQSVIFEQSKGDPAKSVTQLTQKMPGALIVMSTEMGESHQENRFAAITEAIFATQLDRVVLLAPDHIGADWTLHRILLAHDGSAASHAATGAAAELAELSGAKVIALHIASPGQARPQGAGSINAPLYVDQPQHEWPAWANEFLNRVMAAGASPSSVQFKLTLRSGQAGSEVAEVARKTSADLVVMAWHGHWHHETSATRVAVRGSGCPVLLVYSAKD